MGVRCPPQSSKPDSPSRFFFEVNLHDVAFSSFYEGEIFFQKNLWGCLVPPWAIFHFNYHKNYIKVIWFIPVNKLSNSYRMLVSGDVRHNIAIKLDKLFKWLHKLVCIRDLVLASCVRILVWCLWALSYYFPAKK